MPDNEPTFAGYQLHEIVGHTAVSTTYRAVPPGAGESRHVALQISRPLAGLDDERIASVRRKVDAIRDIDHPGVATVVDSGTVDRQLYVATVWQGSIALDSLLDQRRRMPVADAVTLLAPLASGLDAAHAAGVAHGGLSTSTIRVTAATGAGGHRAFLTGFGVADLLALLMGANRQRDLATAFDDLRYIAPEQLRAEELTAATDQYSLACALYHCVAGRPPFVRQSASALFGAHLFATPPLDGLPADDAGRALRQRLVVGLAKDPTKRHASCAQLVGEPVTEPAPLLAGGGQPLPATALTIPPAAAGRSLRHRVPPAAIPVAVLAAVLLLALLAISVLRNTGDATATAQRDGPQAANAAATESERQSPTPASSAPAPPATSEPPMTVDWETAVAPDRISSLIPTAEQLIATAGNQVVGLDPATGAPNWQQAVVGDEADDVVVTDDTVVYRSTVLSAHALADGQQRWTRDDELTPTGALATSPDGVLYGVAAGLGLPEVAAIDPATGDERWHFHGEGGIPIDDSARIAADEGLVVAVEPGSLLALDPDGEQFTTSLGRVEAAGSLWRTDGVDAWRRTLTLTDEAVVIAMRDGTLCSYRRDDGTEQWCQPVTGVAASAPALLAADGRLTIAARFAVTALDESTGAPLWELPTDARITAADASATTVIVADADGAVGAYDSSSGERQWTIRDQGRVRALAATDDAVFVGRRDGTVARLTPTG